MLHDTTLPPARVHHHVVLGHPDPGSFCHALAERYCAAAAENGQDASLEDLYAEGFDPLLKRNERPGPDYVLHDDVAGELRKLRAADVLVLVYPIWFGSPPAIIKGYVDRVMGANFDAENLPRDVPNTMLEGKRLVLISTSQTTRPWLEEHGQYVGLQQAFDRYLADAYGMTGPDRMHFDAIVPGVKPDYLRQCLEELRQHVRGICADVLSARHAAHAREALHLRA